MSSLGFAPTPARLGRGQGERLLPRLFHSVVSMTLHGMAFGRADGGKVGGVGHTTRSLCDSTFNRSRSSADDGGTFALTLQL
ncbi:hypothetical protein AYO44_07545 [Planctomycetaceae bacterium SCGC AG-212-F19]|nr:hypothetical protein AYO44_07545 [Planctomycetaceae bacterium SCGC AG-212-F19]